MRRAALGLLGAAALVAALAAAGGGGGPANYRVDAVFSNAAGLIPGQNVEIAGAVVGEVKAIELTPQHRALVEMDVQTGFAPFRADASCEIKPQSLIGEKFVECDPGSPAGRELRGPVPLARTHSPVDIDLVFAALRRPYVERLSLIVDELGTGLAGRPRDLQLAIKRANPALQETAHLLAMVNRDRGLLGRLIDRSDAVLAQLAPHDRDVTRFIDRADAATTEVANHRDALGASIDRLPPLLAQLEPSAGSLAGVARDARPVVHELSAATPQLRALFSDLAPLTSAGRPALRALRSASDEGRSAVAAARPVAAALKPAAALMPSLNRIVAELTASLRKTGGVEAINAFTWLGSAATGRFDAVSHIIPSYQVTGLCQQYASTPVAGCSAHWAGSAANSESPGLGVGSRKLGRRGRHHRRHRSAANAPGPTAPTRGQAPTPNPQLPTPQIPTLPPLPQLPPPPHLPTSQQQLLDFLLK
ncbi:MAG: MlaD family protein [Thermoleophilaceae bacterium]